MNKAVLTDVVAEKTGLTKKDAKIAINAVLESIVDGLCGEAKVTLVGFGTFSAVKRSARQARNPKTGEAIEVPARVVPKFKASAALKEAVKNLELE